MTIRVRRGQPLIDEDELDSICAAVLHTVALRLARTEHFLLVNDVCREYGIEFSLDAA